MNKRQAKKKRNKSIYRDTWSLDYAIAKFVHPRLVCFRKVANGYPGFLESMDEWYEILDKMIVAFELIIKDDLWGMSDDSHKKIEEGLDLFRKYYFHLWW